MVGDPRVEKKMGCSGSVTRLDGASERQSLLLRSPREVTKRRRPKRNPRVGAAHPQAEISVR